MIVKGLYLGKVPFMHDLTKFREKMSIIVDDIN